MPRPERDIDLRNGKVAWFAVELRRLRHSAGDLTYREMARKTHYSATTLSAAAAGRRLPSLEVMKAFVQACGGNIALWEQRWILIAEEGDRHGCLLGAVTRTGAILPVTHNHGTEPAIGEAGAMMGTRKTGSSSTEQPQVVDRKYPMARRSVALPDDVETWLNEQSDASAAITTAVRAQMTYLRIKDVLQRAEVVELGLVVLGPVETRA